MKNTQLKNSKTKIKLLNKKQEVIAKCRHKQIFALLFKSLLNKKKIRFYKTKLK